MEIACASITYFDEAWLKVAVKREGRERIHEKLDTWLNEVEEMAKGEGGLEEIVNTIFEKRQEGNCRVYY